MIVAIPVAEERVAPLFDAAKRLLIVEYRHGQETQRTEARLSQSTLIEKARSLTKIGTHVLICGAISAPLEMLIASEGIQVIHHTCGPIDAVLDAYASGQLTAETFVMPGCEGHRRSGFGSAAVLGSSQGSRKGRFGERCE